MGYGLRLGLLSRLSQQELTELLADSSDTTERLVLVSRSGKTDLIESDDTRFDRVVDYILDGGSGHLFRPRKTTTVTNALAGVLSPRIYCAAFEQSGPWPLSKVSERYFGHPAVSKGPIELDAIPESEAASRCRKLVDLGVERWEMSVSEWTTQLGPWNDLVESGRKLFGDRWTFAIMANIGAGIRAKDEKSEQASELQDPSLPLCERVRYARLRAGAAKWWEAQLQFASDQSGVAFALLVLLTWAGPSVFNRLSQLIDEKLMSLDVKWWHKLDDGLRSYVFDANRRRIAVDFATIPESISERLMVALATRVGDKPLAQIFRARLMGYEGDDPPTLELCQRIALMSAQSSRGAWRDWLPIVSRTYAKGITVVPFMAYRFYQTVHSKLPPDDIAEEIVEQCSLYPAELVGWAERACRQRVAKKVVAVGNIAETQGWFKS